jgi:superfamily II DNA or RNA helicase
MLLRPYQINAITQITSAFKRGVFKLILQAATGAGKTVIFTELANLVSKKGNKVLILTDRAELLLQAGSNLKQIGLKSFYIADGIKVYNANYNAYIAMSQTFRNRIKLEYWQKFLESINLIIIDECHKQEFNYLFESGLIDKKHVIGFTATPLRTGKMRQLGLDYELIIETVDRKSVV